MSFWIGLLEHNLLIAGAKAFVISVVLTPILRDIFRTYNIVDRPGHRRIHRHPIPRIGGIPIAIAFGVAVFPLSDPNTGLGGPLWKLLPGAALVFITGLLDDFFTLRPVVKLAGQIGAGLLVFYSGLSVGTLGSETPLPLWLNLPLTIFWVLLTTNALNLIDGLDGLCTGIGMVASLTLFVAALVYKNQALEFATLPLVCALLGFLWYNTNPASVFLGDSGALLIGFLLGCYGMIWTQKTSTMLSLLVPLIALSVPLLDVSIAVLRRLLRHQPIFAADSAHIHHRLLDRGLTPRAAVLVLYAFAAVAAALALMLIAPQLAPYRNAFLVLLVAAVGVGLRELRYKEFDVAGRLLFSGAFQRNLQEGLRLEKLRAALNAAETYDAWWMVLVETARECGWAKLTWDSPRRLRQSIVHPSSEPGWKLSVPLGGTGSLEIQGRDSDAGVDLADLAELLKSSARTLEPESAPAAAP